jgi:hypothetical protein
VKAALIALVLTVAAPVHVGVTLLGSPVQFPAGWLVIASEAFAAAALAYSAVRALRRFRSAPWLRLAAGGMP